MKKAITESDVEENLLGILASLGYEVVRGDNEDYLPGGRLALRKGYTEVVLGEKLKNALRKINPSITDDVLEQAVKQVLRSESQKLLVDNENFHKLLVEGVNIPIRGEAGTERYKEVKLFDFENHENNNFTAINQFTVIENNVERRPDVILFVNGLPLVVIELKNWADENATIWTAYNQFQTYKHQLPTLFKYNEMLMVSDGGEARAGTITSSKERFMQWKTINGEKPRKELTEMEVLARGMFDKKRFLDIVRNFIVFEKDKEQTSKKLAAYHQYWAVNRALESTKNARKGNKKAGVVWHTQGSGKSLTMVFYTGKLVRELDNPTVVLLTYRNDLDGQLFGTFGKCNDLLRQTPVQALQLG